MAYRLWLLAHLLGVVAFLATFVLAFVSKTLAERSRDPALVAHAFEAIRFGDRWIMPPAALAMLVSGVMLARPVQPPRETSAPTPPRAESPSPRPTRPGSSQKPTRNPEAARVCLRCESPQASAANVASRTHRQTPQALAGAAHPSLQNAQLDPESAS